MIMASYAECLAALPSFRNDLLRNRALEEPGVAAPLAFSPKGAFAAFATPLTNVHATGVGIRYRNGQYDPNEHVIKVFVFDKQPGDIPDIPQAYGDDQIPVDVEYLPIQTIRATGKGKSSKKGGGRTATKSGRIVITPDAANRARLQAMHRENVAKEKDRRLRVEADAQAEVVPGAATVVAPQAIPPQRERIRPIVGGVSISPLNANFVGTLGCFLLRRNVDTEEVFVLSNNHVLADVDRLPHGTQIVQPGPELPPFVTDPHDAFAALHTTIPIQFPSSGNQPVFNRFDAAIGNVTNGQIIARGSMFGMARAGQPNPNNLPIYDPSRVVSPEPKMRVMKIGRTTGFTRGMITATNVQGLQVNYGTTEFPRIAVFRGTITIVGDNNQPFSLPGDSGSVILEESTGHPVALLFAGDGRTTDACDLGALCQQLGAWPV
jgi:hypothetical protein